MAGEKTAAQVAQVEANAAQTVANVAASTAAIVDAAAADVAAAQETAQQIVAAALATPLATEIAEMKEEAETWENEQEQLHASHVLRLNALETLTSELSSRLLALETPAPLPLVVIPNSPNSPTDQLSIPETSPETTPAITEAVIVQPSALPLNEPNEPIANVLPKRRTRFL
jgi:hypothetical protein